MRGQVAEWTFGINQFQNFVHLRYRTGGTNQFLTWNPNEKVFHIECIRDRYIVIILLKNRDSGSISNHSHSLVSDSNDPWNRFDMQEVVEFLQNAGVNYVMETFQNSGYYPWVDCSPGVTVRRLNNILRAMEHHVQHFVKPRPSIGSQGKKSRQAVEEGPSGTAPLATGSTGSGPARVRAKPRKRAEPQTLETTFASGSKAKRWKSVGLTVTAAAGSSTSALTNVAQVE